MKIKHLLILFFSVFLIFFLNCSKGTMPGNEINLKPLADAILNSNELTINSTAYTLKKNVQIPNLMKDLTSLKTIVKIYDGSVDAGIEIPGFGAKLGKSEKSLSVYFLQTKVVNINQKEVVYGVGYSVHYLFKKIGRNLNITNLPYVAAAVQIDSDKTQVSYCLQTYGITGTILNKFFKPVVSANFDVQGYGVMQSSIDGIHNVLSEPNLAKSLKFAPEELKMITTVDLPK